MGKKLLCAVCKHFVNAKERVRETGRRRCDPTHAMVKDHTELEECVDFDMHHYIWCWAGGGRFSIEICRVASKPECKACSLGQTIRELLPSKLPSFRPGDIHGMTYALQKMERERGENGTRPNVFDRKVPAFNAPLPVTFAKRKPIACSKSVQVVQQAQPAPVVQKKRKPILIRTPKGTNV